MGKTCQICGRDISHRHKLTKYCSLCAKELGKERKRAWRKVHHKIVSNDYYGNLCRECGVILSSANTHLSRAKKSDKICKVCSNKNTVKRIRKDYIKFRKIIFEKLGNKCKCGFSDWRALQIDHIYGDGFLDKRRKGGYRSYLKRLSELSLEDLQKRYQLLCANCNWIKRWDNKEYIRNRE